MGDQSTDWGAISLKITPSGSAVNFKCNLHCTRRVLPRKARLSWLRRRDATIRVPQMCVLPIQNWRRSHFSHFFGVVLILFLLHFLEGYSPTSPVENCCECIFCPHEGYFNKILNENIAWFSSKKLRLEIRFWNTECKCDCFAQLYPWALSSNSKFIFFNKKLKLIKMHVQILEFLDIFYHCTKCSRINWPLWVVVVYLVHVTSFSLLMGPFTSFNHSFCPSIYNIKIQTNRKYFNIDFTKEFVWLPTSTESNECKLLNQQQPPLKPPKQWCRHYHNNSSRFFP